MKISKGELNNLKVQTRRKELKNKTKVDMWWVIKIILIAFIVALVFAVISETFIPKVNLVLGILILIIFIIFGIIFDMVGVAVTAADEAPFHSMSSRKVKGADIAVLLKKNADKVSSFCNDVIGDICGVISGSVGVIIASSISLKLQISDFYISLLVTAIIASLTIGSKAISKSFAINKANIILYEFSKIISVFYKPKNK